MMPTTRWSEETELQGLLAMKDDLPPGYHWRLEKTRQGDTTAISVTLVESHYKPGTLLNRLFSRDLLTTTCETSPDVPREHVAGKISQLKHHLRSLYFPYGR